MLRKISLRKTVIAVSCLCMLLLLSACGTTIQHIPSQSLKAITFEKPVGVMVADIGDSREGESRDRIGQGASFWFPVSYYARDGEGKKMPVSYFVAQSLAEDLNKIGYNTKLANDNGTRASMTLDNSIAVAKKEGMDYLVATKVTDGKTNYWGFLVIPFFEPVWTRLGCDVEVVDLKSEKSIAPLTTFHSETEWYFGKITVLDAIFDAGLFGGHWTSTAWSETVISNALAETARKVSDTIQAKK
jgi:hypothetical protein